MKKVYRLKNLDCANCAAKMERAIQKIDGVVSAEVSFMTQRLVIESKEGMMDQVLEKAKVCIRKVEPDCEIIGG